MRSGSKGNRDARATKKEEQPERQVSQAHEGRKRLIRPEESARTKRNSLCEA